MHAEEEPYVGPQALPFPLSEGFDNLVDIAAMALENVQQLNGQTVDRTIGETQADEERDRELG